MKRIIATGFIAAIAMVGFTGTANAAPGAPGMPADSACFGQIHKAVNSGFLAEAGIYNVGDLVKAAGGQGKNAAAAGLC